MSAKLTKEERWTPRETYIDRFGGKHFAKVITVDLEYDDSHLRCGGCSLELLGEHPCARMQIVLKDNEFIYFVKPSPVGLLENLQFVVWWVRTELFIIRNKFRKSDDLY